ncbi:MAG: esterase/lipase family protein [Nitrososphaerales archaeon]
MSRRQLGIFLGLVAMAASGVGLSSPGVAEASSGPYAPLNGPNPPLEVPTAQLAASLSCTSGLTDASHDPVLLVPGTALNPTDNYSWNYELGLTALGLPWCALTLPDNAMGDIATAGQYVVYAILTMHHESGQRVDILGYSQGGMVPRWALRFWPETRPLVASFVAIDPSNHGTLDAWAACQVVCPPSFWQQATGSQFLAALNSYAETFAGIDYTIIYSRTDEVVLPNFNSEGSSALHTGSGTILNLAVQQVCPADVSEHLLMGTVDPVAYALAIDALTHNSLANPADAPASLCTEGLSPPTNPVTFPVHFASMLASIGAAIATSPETSSEPPLPSYVYAHSSTVRT